MKDIKTIFACLLLCMLACAPQVPAKNQRCDCSADAGQDLAVYALSAGRGVPEETYAAFNAIESQLRQLQKENSEISLSIATIGIEGERKLCTHLPSLQRATEICAQLCQRYKDISLLNIRVEACS